MDDWPRRRSHQFIVICAKGNKTVRWAETEQLDYFEEILVTSWRL